MNTRGILLVVGILLLYQESIFSLKPEKDYRLRPENYGLIYKESFAITSDGKKINTWFFPAQDSISVSQIEKTMQNPVLKEYKSFKYAKMPTLIICNGDAGNMSYLILNALKIAGRGFNVLLFDWRGFGKSDEWHINEDNLCYSEFLLDYSSVIDLVKTFSEVDTSKIGVFGFSTGAYLSFAIASIKPEIKCFIGRGLMTNFNDLMPILKGLLPQRNFIVPTDYKQEWQPITIAESYKKPVLLIVGELDDRTPVWMSQNIYNKLTGPKEIVIVQGALHRGSKGPEYINGLDYFTDILCKFLKKYLPVSY